jgi:hypothetical protein
MTIRDASPSREMAEGRFECAYKKDNRNWMLA